jgi:hypothetical protein
MNYLAAMRAGFGVIAFVLASCATPSALESLPEAEKAELDKTKAEILKVAECADGAQGNDALFTSKCSKMLLNTKLYAKFRQVNTLGMGYAITADVSGSTFITCNTDPRKNLTNKLSKLKSMDTVYVSGMVARYVKTERTEPITIYETKIEKFGYHVELDPCKLEF